MATSSSADETGSSTRSCIILIWQCFWAKRPVRVSGKYRNLLQWDDLWLWWWAENILPGSVNGCQHLLLRCGDEYEHSRDTGCSMVTFSYSFKVYTHNRFATVRA